MAYLDVITLERAKLFLRLEDDFIDDDNEITSMINGACRYIEKKTNHLFYAREVTYKGVCQVKVYDFPINSIVTDPEPIGLERATYTIYPDSREVVLNVGYIDSDEVPNELIQACLQLIKVWYYESEKQVNTTLIPQAVADAIAVNRRFLC